jgi:hypothetical protein
VPRIRYAPRACSLGGEAENNPDTHRNVLHEHLDHELAGVVVVVEEQHTVLLARVCLRVCGAVQHA